MTVAPSTGIAVAAVRREKTPQLNPPIHKDLKPAGRQAGSGIGGIGSGSGIGGAGSGSGKGLTGSSGGNGGIGVTRDRYP